MGIRHSFTSAKSDGGDSSLVRPSDWNANHLGGIELLEQHTASSSATLDFTSCLSSSYDSYIVDIIQLAPANNLAELYLYYSTNGGSTYDTTNGNYAIGAVVWGGSVIASYNNSVDKLQLTVGYGVSTADAANTYDATLHLHKSTSHYPRIYGNFVRMYDTGWPTEGGIVVGTYLSTTAINAMQFKFSSGNIASGTIRVYGIPNT